VRSYQGERHTQAEIQFRVYSIEHGTFEDPSKICSKSISCGNKIHADIFVDDILVFGIRSKETHLLGTLSIGFFLKPL
jgi:hypothetical protein